MILPGLSPLEQPHYDELIWLWAVRNAAKYSAAIFPPPADRPAEWEILLRPRGARAAARRSREVDVGAARRLLLRRPGGDAGGATRLAHRRTRSAAIVAATPGAGRSACSTSRSASGRTASATAPTPDGLTLARLREHPHGIDFGALEPRLPELLETPDRKIELAPPYITADVVASARAPARAATRAWCW